MCSAMSINQNPTLKSTWPHAEGIVRLAYAPTGDYIYTGGSESYIRVYNTDDNEEAGEDVKLIEYHTEGINSIDCSVRSSP